MPRAIGFQLVDTPLLARTAIDRAEELRDDNKALVAGWSAAQLLRVNARGQVALDNGRLVFDEAVSLGTGPVEDAVFLGRGADGVHVWAVRDNSIDVSVADLRLAGDLLDDVGAGLLASAVALLNWHDQARFSPVDGSLTKSAKGGWVRVNTVTGHEEFPRTDPAVICLVHDGADRVLLARAPMWPPRRFSLLAGFVEAGESLEACVAREIAEEVGLVVQDIQYLGSQPWPFPRSI
ncbi:MAG: NAD(+) diphosphatase, partial [Mycobacteriaceae bacterium]